MLVRLFNTIIDLSLVYHYELYEASWNCHGGFGLSTIRCYIRGHDKVYIHFNNEDDARHALDCIELCMEVQRVGNDEMYEKPVELEGTVDEVAEAMSHLQELIQKNQSKEEDK
tara:strand:+ start:597 stop:935 length:339 start_codon:yes stop_codon:yes gene_type:complete